MNDNNSKVICPHCKKIVRKRNLKEIKDSDPKDYWCTTCKTKNHRKQLKQYLPPIPHKKPRRKPKVLMNALELEQHNAKVKEKRVGRMIVPIKHIEERILWDQLRSEGFSNSDIKERISKLKQVIISNHNKAKEKEP
jgi:hypothetical protein